MFTRRLQPPASSDDLEDLRQYKTEDEVALLERIRDLEESLATAERGETDRSSLSYRKSMGFAAAR